MQNKQKSVVKYEPEILIYNKTIKIRKFDYISDLSDTKTWRLVTNPVLFTGGAGRAR